MTFKCYECGRKFKTVKAAEKASWDGCPKCGGADIDVDLGIGVPATIRPDRGETYDPVTVGDVISFGRYPGDSEVT